jgi:hypothetical protein
MSFGGDNLMEIVLDGKNYPVKRILEFGEVRKHRAKLSNLIEASEKAKLGEATEEMTKFLLERTKEQDDLIADTITACVECDVNKLSYATALTLYSEVFRLSTEVPKNLVKPATLG